MEAKPGYSQYPRLLIIFRLISSYTVISTVLAKALHGLELLDAVRLTLTDALRRKKARSRQLSRAIRYERNQVYEDLRQARSEFEKLYAETPDYEDVSARLGLEALGRAEICHFPLKYIGLIRDITKGNIYATIWFI